MKLSRRVPVLTSLVLPMLALSLAGCPDPDPDGPVPCPAIAQVEQRNPETGICEARDQWDCDMGPRPGEPMPLMAPELPWAACYTACEQLDEAACDASDTCQTAYIDGSFWGCWETTLYYVAEGACGELGAMDCATREDCNPNYYHSDVLPGGPSGQDEGAYSTRFNGCTADGAVPSLTCANVLCNIGTQCEMLNSNGETCFEDEAMPPDCQPVCVPVTVEPGSCYGDVSCDGPPGDCPDGTLPGIADGCWTGYCIPLAACEPPPSCDAVASEVACISREDCAPLYQACGPAEFCPTGYKYWGCTGA
ncbi:MAG: hypothetical protein IPL79_09975 [Myxococcales bacterium]|nr:hypothetical protein [Myxococcales bacterium]